jgi:hypothetical protein
MIVLLEYLAPHRFVLSLKFLRLLRVLRPLRALSIIPALRDIMSAIVAAVRDLGSTLIIYCFFLTVFGVLFSSLFAGMLRSRCVDDTGNLYEQLGEVCALAAPGGRQCPPPPDGTVPMCVDAGAGPFAHLDGLAPFYRVSEGEPPRPLDANPPYLPHFDSFFWSVLAVFVLWAGVGWTEMMYNIADSQGRHFEGLFMLAYVLGGPPHDTPALNMRASSAHTQARSRSVCPR